MSKSFEVKLKGRLGTEAQDLKEMRVLNRLIRVVPEGLLYEPDPRHVEMLAEHFNFEIGKTSSNVTPGQKAQIPGARRRACRRTRLSR